MSYPSPERAGASGGGDGSVAPLPPHSLVAASSDALEFADNNTTGSGLSERKLRCQRIALEEMNARGSALARIPPVDSSDGSDASSGPSQPFVPSRPFNLATDIAIVRAGMLPPPARLSMNATTTATSRNGNASDMASASSPTPPRCTIGNSLFYPSDCTVALIEESTAMVGIASAVDCRRRGRDVHSGDDSDTCNGSPRARSIVKALTVALDVEGYHTDDYRAQRHRAPREELMLMMMDAVPQQGRRTEEAERLLNSRLVDQSVSRDFYAPSEADQLQLRGGGGGGGPSSVGASSSASASGCVDPLYAMAREAQQLAALRAGAAAPPVVLNPLPPPFTAADTAVTVSSSSSSDRRRRRGGVGSMHYGSVRALDELRHLSPLTQFTNVSVNEGSGGGDVTDAQASHGRRSMGALAEAGAATDGGNDRTEDSPHQNGQDTHDQQHQQGPAVVTINIDLSLSNYSDSSAPHNALGETGGADGKGPQRVPRVHLGIGLPPPVVDATHHGGEGGPSSGVGAAAGLDGHVETATGVGSSMVGEGEDGGAPQPVSSTTAAAALPCASSVDCGGTDAEALYQHYQRYPFHLRVQEEEVLAALLFEDRRRARIMAAALSSSSSPSSSFTSGGGSVVSPTLLSSMPQLLALGQSPRTLGGDAAGDKWLRELCHAVAKANVTYSRRGDDHDGDVYGNDGAATMVRTRDGNRVSSSATTGGDVSGSYQRHAVVGAPSRLCVPEGRGRSHSVGGSDAIANTTGGGGDTSSPLAVVPPAPDSASAGVVAVPADPSSSSSSPSPSSSTPTSSVKNKAAALLDRNVDVIVAGKVVLVPAPPPRYPLVQQEKAVGGEGEDEDGRGVTNANADSDANADGLLLLDAQRTKRRWPSRADHAVRAEEERHRQSAVTAIVARATTTVPLLPPMVSPSPSPSVAAAVDSARRASPHTILPLEAHMSRTTPFSAAFVSGRGATTAIDGPFAVRGLYTGSCCAKAGDMQTGGGRVGSSSSAAALVFQQQCPRTPTAPSPRRQQCQSSSTPSPYSYSYSSMSARTLQPSVYQRGFHDSDMAAMREGKQLWSRYSRGRGGGGGIGAEEEEERGGGGSAASSVQGSATSAATARVLYSSSSSIHAKGGASWMERQLAEGMAMMSPAAAAPSSSPPSHSTCRTTTAVPPPPHHPLSPSPPSPPTAFSFSPPPLSHSHCLSWVQRRALYGDSSDLVDAEHEAEAKWRDVELRLKKRALLHGGRGGGGVGAAAVKGKEY